MLLALTEGLFDAIPLEPVPKAEQILRSSLVEFSEADYHRLFELYEWKEEDRKFILDAASAKLAALINESRIKTQV